MKKAVVLLLMFFFIISFYTSVSAQENIQFAATRAYWDAPYRLAVEGYFKNTGTQNIIGITYFDLTVYYEHRYTGEYLYLGEGVWKENPDLMHVYLRPGETSLWTFYLKTESYPQFTYWKYRWYTRYNYQK